MQKGSLVAFGIFALGCGSSSPAWAWNEHRSFMPWLVSGLPEALQKKLEEPIPAPCPEQDEKMYHAMVQTLALNPERRVPDTAPEACRKKASITGKDILEGPFVDDPDQGMDRELPDSADPEGDRRWMGGSHGPSSQGFRHMYFGGWQILRPIRTFQIPAHAIGQAPRRVELIAAQAKERLQAGDRAWGFRLLAWALHYAQDLNQPFHAVQIVDFRMVPWSALFEWPPAVGFDNLVKETTRTITNFHWGFEGYTQARVHAGDQSPFKKCFLEPEKFASDELDPVDRTAPIQIAYATARRSIGLTSRLGRAELEFFGTHLKEPGVSIPAHRGEPNYAEYANRADLAVARDNLEAVTCAALANTALTSRALIQWALEP